MLTEPIDPVELTPVTAASALPIAVVLPKDAVATNPVTEKVTGMDTHA